MSIIRNTALFVLLASSVAPFVAARQQATQPILFEEHFDAPSGPILAPAWGCDAPLPAPGGWKVGNHRPDFMATNTNTVQFSGGEARMFTVDNSATGGYPNLFHPIASNTRNWRLTSRVKVDYSVPSLRPVPSIFTNMPSTPTEPCNMFANDDPAGLMGWQANGGQVLTLLDGVGQISAGYVIPSDGSYHTVELISRPGGSELRAWPDGQRRPLRPLAVGTSLGTVKRILFYGPNWQNFDYSVDFVLLERLPRLLSDPLNAPTSGETRSLIDEDFDGASCSLVAPAWACDVPFETCLDNWLLGNTRSDFMSSNTNRLMVAGGAARLYSDDNHGAGGYIGFFRPVPELPTSFSLTVRVKVDEAYAERPVPECLINTGVPASPDACSLFPDDDPAGKLGWHTTVGQEVVLRDGAGAINTGYILPADGTYHTIEIVSTPTGSELRAWPDSGARPAAPLALGQSLGPVRRVLFGGPNYRDFDYSVSSVKLDRLP